MSEDAATQAFLRWCKGAPEGRSLNTLPRRQAYLGGWKDGLASASTVAAGCVVGPAVVYRPQRGSLAESMRERVAFYSIETFKRHVLTEWTPCESITVEPCRVVDKRSGSDTHLVRVDGMAVGYTDRAVPGLSKVEAGLRP